MNLGWFTALAAAHGLQVVAFEPSAAKVKPLCAMRAEGLFDLQAKGFIAHMGCFQTALFI